MNATMKAPAIIAVKMWHGFHQIATSDRTKTTPQTIAQKIELSMSLVICQPEQKIGGNSRHFANDVRPIDPDPRRLALA